MFINFFCVNWLFLNEYNKIVRKKNMVRIRGSCKVKSKIKDNIYYDGVLLENK